MVVGSSRQVNLPPVDHLRHPPSSLSWIAANPRREAPVPGTRARLPKHQSIGAPFGAQSKVQIDRHRRMALLSANYVVAGAGRGNLRSKLCNAGFVASCAYLYERLQNEHR
jgi:hypothetical protein